MAGICRNVNERTSLKSAWSNVRKIDGKSVKPCISHIGVKGKHVTSKPEIVQSIAQALYDKSSGNSYDPDFTRRKVQIEEQPLQFNIDDVSNYNDDITMAELQKAISLTGNFYWP